jgi:lipopolysaccharide/colanic/teichoic acid biosynthesis glycosyltransferase
MSLRNRVFGQDESTMRRGVLYGGTVAIVLGLGKVHAAYIGHYDFSGSSRFAWSFAYIVLLALAAYAVGLPDLTGGRSPVLLGLAATGLAAAAISVLQLVLGSLLLPRFVVFVAAVVLVPWYGLSARLTSGGQRRQAGRDRVVAVVTREEAACLAGDLALEPERPAILAAAITAEEAVSSGIGGTPLADRAREERATIVVLDREAQLCESIVAQVADLHQAGIRVRSLGLFYEEWLGKLALAELERTSLMFDIGEVHRQRYGRVKRIVDLVVALVGSVAVAVLVPFVVVGNLVANRGPLLYRQRRVGKNGGEFTILKFRTMRPTATGLANEWTIEDDPRITPFGRVLRKSHLDELPQVVNVLKGDLSIVGPRPEQPHYVAELVEKLPFYDLRHLVRPGLTGWAQVKYGYAGSESDALEKLQYDFYYLRHQDIALDLRIIGRTVRSVLRSSGR